MAHDGAQALRARGASSSARTWRSWTSGCRSWTATAGARGCASGGRASPASSALTGYGQGEDRSRARPRASTRHFVKPVRLEELEAFFRELRPPARGAA